MPSKVFGALPLDVQKLIVQRLDGASMSALSKTCKEMDGLLKGAVKFENVQKKMKDLQAAIDKAAMEIEASKEIIDANPGKDNVARLFVAAAEKAKKRFVADQKTLDELLTRVKNLELLPAQRATLNAAFQKMKAAMERADAALSKLAK